EQRWHFESSHVVNIGERLFVRQFARVPLGKTVRVTMHTPQVASARDIPYHNGTTFACRFRSAVPVAVPEIVCWLILAAIEFCYVYHSSFLYLCDPTHGLATAMP